jgi:hypothetical protein
MTIEYVCCASADVHFNLKWKTGQSLNQLIFCVESTGKIRYNMFNDPDLSLPAPFETASLSKLAALTLLSGKKSVEVPA